MCQQGLGNVDGDATEEDEEHKEPFEVFAKRAEERSFTDTVPHGREGDVAETVEDDYEGDPDVPGIDVVFVDIWWGDVSIYAQNHGGRGLDKERGKEAHTSFVPSNHEVIHDRHDPCGADSIVRADVGDDVDFGSDGDV